MTASLEIRRARVLPWLEWALFAAIAAALVAQALVPPAVGLADNGDSIRVTTILGATPVAVDGERYFSRWVRVWALGPPGVWSGYVTSELPFAAAATLAGRLVGRPDRMDLRLLGAVHLAAWLAACAWLLHGLRRFPLAVRATAGAALAVIVTDVGYVAYANSFYSEPSSLLFLLLVVAAALPFASGECPCLAAAPWLLAAAMAGLVAAKAQNAALALPLAALLWVLVRRGRNGRRRLATVLACALVLFAAVFARFGNHRWLRNGNVYNALFVELLPHSPDPAADLRALGLDPALLSLSGTLWMDRVETWTNPAFESAVFDRVGPARLALFYLRRPGRVAGAAVRTLPTAFVFRPEDLGNFSTEAGRPPGARTASFSVWSRARAALLAGSPWPPFAFLLAQATLSASLLSRARGAVGRALAGLHATMLAIAVVQLLTVVLLAGPRDAVKQLFLFNAACDATIVLALAAAAAALTRRTARAGAG
ncbi:MAG: hypothetical protein AB1625_05175 [Acidobacteriota bacterium]